MSEFTIQSAAARVFKPIPEPAIVHEVVVPPEERVPVSPRYCAPLLVM